MPTAYQTISACTVFILAAGALASDWVEFTNETTTRLLAEAFVGANDTREKDYIWGDVDQDGDIDLIVVRKLMGTTSIGFRNVLFMNEGIADGHAIDGVLVDRTIEFIPEFMDITNDRDVALEDLDGDGWLDIITVTVCNGCSPSTGLLPRIYINQGTNREGWIGFVWEEVRMPSFSSTPNFNGVGVGDVTGDGSPDLYFTDSFTTLEDRLLINNGNGFFIDETETRVPPWLTNGLFGGHAIIADLNHDSYNDILKVDVIVPHDLRVLYSNPENVGFFSEGNGQIISNDFGLFVAIGDLNSDELLDVVMASDHSDLYFLNQGNAPDGKVIWHNAGNGSIFPNSNSGFDSNTVIADLNNDGFNDVLIADVEVDLPFCSERLDIHHNLADPPNVTFEEDVGNLPTNEGGPLRGTHDIAVFDIDGDCWLDLIIGNCTGTTVWINQGEGSICSSCTGDLDNDKIVSTSDLLELFAQWGTVGPADFDGSGVVDTNDLLILLANWGPCP